MKMVQKKKNNDDAFMVMGGGKSKKKGKNKRKKEKDDTVSLSLDLLGSFSVSDSTMALSVMFRLALVAYCSYEIV